MMISQRVVSRQRAGRRGWTRNRRATWLVAATLAACGGIQKPPEPNRAINLSTKIDTFSLRNGTRVLLIEDTGTDLVHVAARYDVGATADPPGKNGLAHLVEHLAFLVSDQGRRVDSWLTEAALTYNAATELDITHYYSVANSVELERLLAAEAARLAPGACATISDDDFAREREIVLNELRARHRRGASAVLAALNATVYPADHPYRRLVGGSEDTVASITKDDACAFMDRFYVPAHVTLVVTGNADKREVALALDKTLNRVPGRAPNPIARPPEVAMKPGRNTRRLPVDAAQMYVAWSLPPMLTDRRTAAQVAMRQLERRVAGFADEYGFATGVNLFETGGAFAPVAVLAIRLAAPGKADEAWEFVSKAAARIDESITDRGFTALKQRELSQFVRGFDSMGARAARFADYLQMADGTRGYFIEELQRIDTLTRGSVKQVSGDVFDPGKATVMVVIPDESGAEPYRQVAIGYAALSHEQTGREVPVDPDEAAAPLSVPLPRSPIANARRFELDNGMEVALLPSSSVPVVDIRLVFRAGGAAEPADKSGVASVAAEFLQTAFEATSRAEVDAALKFVQVGGVLRANVDDDTTEFRVVGLEGYFDILLAGLERTVKAGVYDQDAIERYRGRVAAQLGERGVLDSQAHSQAVYRAVYGPDHAYARSGFWTPASVKRIGRDVADEYRRRHFVASNALLVVTGKFDVELMEQHVRYHFGSWSSGTSTPPVTQPGRTTGERVGVISAPRPTVAIDIAYPAPAGVGDDQATWLIMARMIGGRVSAVRGEQGASYGMSASLITKRGPSMLRVSGTVDRRRAGEALAAVRAAIDELRRGEGSFAADFALARRKVVAGLSATTGSAASLSADLSLALEYGLASDYLGELARRAARVTPADVSRLLERALAPERQSVVLYGADADVRAAFAAAGITDAQIRKPRTPRKPRKR